jgi:hypothetical protein
VVVANYDSDSVSVLTGNGYGAFVDAGTPYETGMTPISVAVGDVNGDKRPDIVTADELDNGVSVLLNMGGGTFGAAIPSGTGQWPQTVVVGKFDDDEFDDVATADNLDDTVSILISNGDGSFQAPVSVPVGAAPLGLVAADLNGDHLIDLAVASNGLEEQPPSVTVLAGDGHGHFTALPPMLSDKLVSPTDIAAGNITGAETPDLVVVNELDDSVLLMRATGNFTFEAAQTFAVGVLPAGLAVDDLDGDGVKDIATCSPFESAVDVLRGKGDGTFETFQQFPAGSGAGAVVAANVNGDRGLDLLTANAELGIEQDDGEGTLSVLLNAIGGLPVCTGDCEAGGSVSGADLAGMASIALDSGDLVRCGAGDANFDGRVTVEELVQAAANALSSDCVR